MNHTLTKYFSLIIFFLLIFSSCQVNTDKETDTMIKQAIGNSSIERGMNLGNALEAPIPGDWGVIIQPEYFDVIKTAGFDTVRLPVRFSAHAGLEPPYLLEDDFIQMVDQIIGQGLSTGLNIILDLHHYEEIMSDPESHSERYLAIWKQLAEHYQSYPSNLYFEILNEPNQNMSADKWNELAGNCIRLIRESNPQRIILVGGVDYNSIDSLQFLSLPADDNLLAVVHFYEPFAFTHQGAHWVDNSDEWAGTNWDASLTEKQAVTDRLDQIADWSVENNIPIAMTEFGSINSADAASRQRWTSFIARESEKRNIGWIYWDFCAEFSVYDCDRLTWDINMLEALVGSLR